MDLDRASKLKFESTPYTSAWHIKYFINAFELLFLLVLLKC